MSSSDDPSVATASSPDPHLAGKLLAAKLAASLVEPGMAVGLGTGSTASLLIHELAQRQAREGLEFVGVPTSRTTQELARSLGIKLIELDDVAALDLAIDGADEVDPAFELIKGRGGALLREKIVADAAHRRVILVTPDKLVEHLGHAAPVPVEVSEFGLRHTENALRNQGASTSLRRASDGSLYQTDEGHRIIDCRFLEIADPAELNARLKSIVGVFETGLFVDLCDQLVIGRDGAAEIVSRPSRNDSST